MRSRTIWQFSNLAIDKKLKVFCDGGARANPGPAAIGFVIKDSQGKVLAKKGKYIGKATNNVAEYTAVIESLKWLKNYQKTIHYSLSTIHYYLDSLLVTNQLNGLFKIKNAKLRDLVIQVRGLENQLKAQVYYQHIPREKNREADALLNRALDARLDPRRMRGRKKLK